MKISDKYKKQFNDIVDGWKNYVIRNPLTEAQSLHRTAICVKCPNMKDDGISRCGICNCPLSMLTRSIEAECKNPIDQGGAKW